jgi:hypothetical protein
VRFDGSCYYRTVSFAALRYHLLHSNRAALTGIAQQLRALAFDNWWETKEHCKLLNFVTELFDAQLSPATAVELLEATFANDSNGLDAALMRACRKLVANKVRSGEIVAVGDLPFDMAFEGDIEQVCRQYH